MTVPDREKFYLAVIAEKNLRKLLRSRLLNHVTWTQIQREYRWRKTVLRLYSIWAENEYRQKSVFINDNFPSRGPDFGFE